MLIRRCVTIITILHMIQIAWAKMDDTNTISTSASASLKGNSDASSDDFATPLQKGDVYDNPPSFNNWHGLPGGVNAFKFMMAKNNENVPTDSKVLDETIPVHNLTSFKSKDPRSKLFATWLGHATVLVELEGARMITDPVWCNRASFLKFAGPKRYRPPPMKIEHLPPLDFGVISHDHYDHLDIEAVLKIHQMNPNMRWFVPMGMKTWLESESMNVDCVTEMSWGESVDVQLNNKNFTIWCLPAQHWGRRGVFDHNKRLWCGWALVGPEKRFYYSGDTGNCDKEFKKIGEKLGPFDLAAIPIGAYAPRWFMCSQHIDPEEAVGVHEMIRSKTSIGIHWGTYHMGSHEYYLEPRDKLKEIMDSRKDLRNTKFITIEMGKIWEE